jgi:alanyl-tRNA synthetase
MNLSGKTEDNKNVISGVFKFYDTVGLPLPDVLNYLKDNNLVCDWEDFINTAKKSGWKKSTLISRVKEAIQDSYNDWNEFNEKFIKLVDHIYA